MTPKEIVLSGYEAFAEGNMAKLGAIYHPVLHRCLLSHRRFRRCRWQLHYLNQYSMSPAASSIALFSTRTFAC